MFLFIQGWGIFLSAATIETLFSSSCQTYEQNIFFVAAFQRMIKANWEICENLTLPHLEMLQLSGVNTVNIERVVWETVCLNLICAGIAYCSVHYNAILVQIWNGDCITIRQIKLFSKCLCNESLREHKNNNKTPFNNVLIACKLWDHIKFTMFYIYDKRVQLLLLWHKIVVQASHALFNETSYVVKPCLTKGNLEK